MKKLIVLRGTVKQDVEASIRFFEKQMALITRTAISDMRNAIRNDNVNTDKFRDDTADEVAEVAEDFACDVADDLEERHLEITFTRKRVSPVRMKK